MPSRRLALTGPSAAALHEADGFREQTWPDLWCSPITGRPGPRIIRARDWERPTELGDTLVCPLPLVLRHLNAVPDDLRDRPDGIAPIDRVELAVEYALRNGATVTAPRGGAQPGDRMLREVLARRGDVPPTESYAETRTVQRFRRWGLVPLRQLPVLRNGIIEYRADFLLPFRPMGRPAVLQPHHGLLIEVDSKEHHQEQFERDTRRNSTYDELGYHWVAITPNQVEFRPDQVLRALRGAFRRAGYDPG